MEGCFFLNYVSNAFAEGVRTDLPSYPVKIGAESTWGIAAYTQSYQEYFLEWDFEQRTREKSPITFQEKIRFVVIKVKNGQFLVTNKNPR